MEKRRKRILYYIHYHNSFGHFQIVLAQVQAIKEQNPDFDVLVVSGGTPLNSLSFPSNVGFVQMPSLGPQTKDFSGLKSDSLSLSTDQIIKMRKEMLLSLVKNFRPNVIVTEFFPFGRLRLKGEILPMIQYAKKHLAGCKIISSMMDIYGRNVKNSNKANRLVNSRLARYYDFVFIHGDPKVHRINQKFTPAIKNKIIYTGYLLTKKKGHLISPQTLRRQYSKAVDRPLIVASAGGGMDGFHLIKNVVKAAKLLNSEKIKYDFVVSTGSFISEKDHRTLLKLVETCRSVQLKKFTPNLFDLVEAADLSISMGGYNTCAEILSSPTNAIIVPRDFEPEQKLRAQSLKGLDLVETIYPNDITPRVLASRITKTLTSTHMRHNINTNGANFVASFIGSA